MSTADFIGKGWRFPIKVDSRGRLNWSEGPGRVQDAIWLIVKTAAGERLMRPRFGSGAIDHLFRPNTPANRDALATAVRTALLNSEPRIDLQAVRADPVVDAPSQVLVTIEYRLRTTNELFNIVYPFYIEEGVG